MFTQAKWKLNLEAFIVDYGNRKIYLSELRSKIKVIGNIFDNKDLLD